MEQVIGSMATEIVIERGLVSPLLPERAGRATAAILTHPGATAVAVEVARRLGEEGLITDVIGLPDRDEAKTLDVAGGVYEALARLGLNRQDTIVSVGGGSVSDLGGFVAATWLRGVEAVHVPTTLLAAVDAAIGGKTGINLAGKNLVGAFWFPSRVVIDIDILEKLPGHLIKEGMAEAYKAGLVGDAELVAVLETQGGDADLGAVVRRAAAVKLDLVRRDPYERGDRAFLNFGHTIGHGLELASTLSHGDSVSLGTVAAVAMSERLTGFEETTRVVETLDRLGLPTTAPGLDRERVLELLALDKKRDSDGLRMVLLESIGDPVLRHVDRAELEIGLSAIGL